MTPAENQKLEWLQALRGVAAMMVLFYHLGTHWAQSFHLSHGLPIVKWGFSGVDVFFVLSGLVVSMSAERLSGPGEARRFFSRRAIRVYFGYWPALVFAMLVFGLLDNAQYHADQKAFSSLLLLSFWPGNHWLGTAWTLSFELYFYLGMALLICFGKKSNRPMLLALAFMAVASWNAGLMFYDKSAFVGGAQPLRTWMSAYILEFIAGALIASFRQQVRWNPVLAVVALSLAFASAAVGSFSEWFDRIELLRVGSFGVAAVAIVFIALMLQAANKLQPPRWLVAVGDASYSLYLLHASLVALLYILLDRLKIANSHARLLYEIAVPVVCIGFSYAWYRLIEYPLHRWGVQTLMPDRPAKRPAADNPAEG
ncbi:acyltransferase [soil metagenome]